MKSFFHKLIYSTAYLIGLSFKVYFKAQFTLPTHRRLNFKLHERFSFFFFRTALPFNAMFYLR